MVEVVAVVVVGSSGGAVRGDVGQASRLQDVGVVDFGQRDRSRLSSRAFEMNFTGMQIQNLSDIQCAEHAGIKQPRNQNTLAGMRPA